ncbi:MAG: low affinity iron permease family protein [Alsobacter sp.]
MNSPRSWMTHVGTWLARPTAFVVLGIYIVAWGVFSHESLFEWHSIATIATWAMTLFIQRAEHRDTQAIHAKLDEILRSRGEMNSDLSHVDEEEPEEIEKLRHKAG